MQGVHLADLLPAIEHVGFPVDELHWDTFVTADTVGHGREDLSTLG